MFKNFRWNSALLALMGCALLAATAVVNYKFGHTLALDPEDAKIQAIAGLLIDLLGAVLISASVYKWYGGHKITAGMAFVLMIFCMGYSMFSIVGFGASGRVEKSRMIEERAKAARDTASKEAELTAAARKETADWLKSTFRQAEGKERSRLIDEVVKLGTSNVDVKAPMVTSAMGDPQSEVFAERMGVSKNAVQFWLMFSIAAILKAGEILCFGMASQQWNRKDDQTTGVMRPGVAYIRSDASPIQGNQILNKSDASLLRHGSDACDVSRGIASELQLALKTAYSEEAARREYEQLDPLVRSALKHTYLSDRWGRDRQTVARWRRAWDAELSMTQQTAGLRVLNGGRVN
jgi:hypothetical protein